MYQELCFVFEKFGGILSSRFVRDDGNSPFGYVHYDNIKSAEDAVKAANSEEGISLNGTRLIVERFVPLEVSASRCRRVGPDVDPVP